MRRLVRAATFAWVALAVSGIANAADLGLPPSPAPQPAYIPPPPPFSWTGFYIGANLGVAWTQGDVTDSFGNSFSNSRNAVFAGGGQVGGNFQINWIVVGVEADFDWLANNNNSSNAVFVPGVGSLQVSANDRWITTLAARVGVAVNNWLFYAKGGGGWVGVNEFTLTDVTTGASISGSKFNSNSGWLAGAGIEWAFAPNWTAKVEYNFLGLESSTLTVPDGTPGLLSIGGDTVTVRNRDIQTVTVGLNYLFNWYY